MLNVFVMSEACSMAKTSGLRGSQEDVLSSNITCDTIHVWYDNQVILYNIPKMSSTFVEVFYLPTILPKPQKWLLK